ncbi:hypothetical protein [Mycetocola saprophilus]|uniref:hypothetical protein n=1 Tax=Mycetocola saprophilus TaxID=76636 RepID=UPI0004BEE8CC|nr:hypothetical protein [Mycetocola saprophilus]
MRRFRTLLIVGVAALLALWGLAYVVPDDWSWLILVGYALVIVGGGLAAKWIQRRGARDHQR